MKPNASSYVSPLVSYTLNLLFLWYFITYNLKWICATCKLPTSNVTCLLRFKTCICDTPMWKWASPFASKMSRNGGISNFKRIRGWECSPINSRMKMGRTGPDRIALGRWNILDRLIQSAGLGWRWRALNELWPMSGCSSGM